MCHFLFYNGNLDENNCSFNVITEKAHYSYSIYLKVINPQMESGQKACLYLLEALSCGYWLRRQE